jgi:hypothetical protein
MQRTFTNFLLLFCAPVMAQESQLGAEFRLEGKDFSNDCGSFKSAFSCAKDLVTDHPMHLSAGSIAPGNGVGLGPGFVYDWNASENWRLNLNADGVVSTNGSWRTGIYLKALFSASKPVQVVHKRPDPNQPKPKTTPLFGPVPELNFYAQGISLNKLEYYGLGPFSSRQNLALYGMQETIVGGNGVYPLGKTGLALFGELNGRLVSLRGRHGDSSPSIEQLYTEATAPGLLKQPGYFQAGEGLRLTRDFGDHLNLQWAGTLQQFGATDSKYSFQRWTLDFSHQIPIYSKEKQRRAPSNEAVGPDQSPAALEASPYHTNNVEGSFGLRVLLSESIIPAGHVEPFYFQPTLGGNDINGNWKLGSYADYRFRAPNVLLFHGSFEHSLWGPIGATIMSDFGRVALTRADIGFDHFRHSYAAGFTIRAGAFPQVWLLFAWAGREGTHTTAYINPVLLGGSSRPSLF